MKQISRRRFVEASTIGSALALSAPALAGAAPAGDSATRAVAQDAPIEIVFSHVWGTPPGGEAPAEKHPVDQLIDAFNAQSTDVKVISRTDSGVYYEVLQKAQAELAAGNPPAMVSTPWANIHYADEGLGIINLEDIAGDELDEVFGNLKENVIPLVQVDGKTKGVPFSFSCPVVYYNADILEEAGVAPEDLFATWDSFAAEAPKVQEVLGGNPVFGVAVNYDWPAQSIIQSNGGAVLNDDDEPVMNSPEAIEALQTIADLETAGFYDTSTVKETRASFLAGSTACLIASISSLFGIKTSATFNLKTAPFPTFGDKPRQMSSGGSFIGIYARDEDQQQAAWEFIKYALSEEGYSIWMKSGYLNASNFEVPVVEGQEAAYIQLEEGLTAETAWPGARGGELQAIWGDYVSRIWANDISAEEGCQQAVDELGQIMS